MTEVLRLSWAEVCARRLDRHSLSTPSKDARPADIVRAMCGAHAQVLSAAELSIGLRIAGIARIDVQEALWSERSLVKTYGPRGTVHLLPTHDLPMWAGALAAMPYARNVDVRSELLTPEQAEAVIEAIAAVLEDAELTADELTEALVDRVGSWAGDPVGWATKLFDSLSGELQQVEFDGMLAWVAEGDTAAPSEPPKGLRLLPYFDAYAVGCQPREKVFAGRAAERALAGGQAGNFPVLLVDGVVAGVWHQRRSGRKLDITVEALDPLTASQRRELDDQVERIGAFLEARPQWALGTVTVGPHA